jgi:Zn-dependent protease/predicted transcriptional regulator
MDGTRIRVLRVRGIPVYVDLSWLIVLALVTLTLAGEFSASLREQGFDPPTYQVWGMALIAAVGFFVCIVLHELGHALVGRASGMPIGGITLFLFGGVAELRREPPSAGSEFRMAVAGPMVTLVLVAIFWSATLLGAVIDLPAAVVLVLHYLAYINLAVLVFNLVPAFPLDGGRIFRATLWAFTGDLRRATAWASAVGRGFGWLLAGIGLLELFAGLFLPGIWLIFIGMFLARLARQSYESVVVRETLADQPVSKFMSRHPITVAPEVTLQELVDDYVYRHHRKAFPVTSNGHVEGIVTAQSLQTVPREDWDRHTVAEIMDRDIEKIAVRSDTNAVNALERMQRSGSSRLLVMENDELAGVVSIRDLIDYLDLRLSMEPR